MKMEWDELSPRERDALVAEHVMGWKPSPTLIDGWVLQDGTHINHGGFHPSTNIADAWQVVEKFKQEKLTFIEISLSNYSCKTLISTPNGNYEVEAPTATEAICKAALRACGVDID
jgi:hypothetical protein